MKYTFIFTLTIALLFLSCKKKEKASLGSSPTISDPEKVDGVISIRNWTSFNTNSTQFSINFLEAILYDSPYFADIPNSQKGVDAGKLTVNKVNIEKFIGAASASTPTYCTYQDQTGTEYIAPITFSIQGGSKFPSLQIIHKKSNPVFYGYYKLPDTLYSGRDNSFLLEELKDAEQVQLEVYIPINTLNTKIIHKEIGIYQVTITKDEVESIKQAVGNGYATLNINLKTRSFIMVKNKTFKIEQSATYMKSGVTIK